MQCGDDEESDVAFHFNPRFGETNCTVRNTYVDGSWQDEEREEESFPFEKKDTFEIVIKVMEDKFMVCFFHTICINVFKFCLSNKCYYHISN